MEAAAGDPTKNSQIGIVTVIKDITGRKKADTPPGTALEVVLVEAVTSERGNRTRITVDLAVYEGGVVAMPTSATRTDRYSWAVVRTVRTDIGHHK